MKIKRLKNICKDDEFILTVGLLKKKPNRIVDEVEIEIVNDVYIDDESYIIGYFQVLATDEIQLKLLRYIKISEEQFRTFSKVIEIFGKRFY